MTFDDSILGKVKITMANYIRDVLEGCTDITGTIGAGAVQTSKRVYKVVIGL